jgi:predicted AlkP superfamily pyrophosphatase or phosphodiesterase
MAKFCKTVVLDVVGLTRYKKESNYANFFYRDLLTSGHMPELQKWVNSNGESITTIEPAFPAVTCVPQTTYLTGKSPSEHGIVANGFYDKEFW